MPKALSGPSHPECLSLREDSLGLAYSEAERDKTQVKHLTRCSCYTKAAAAAKTEGGGTAVIMMKK